MISKEKCKKILRKKQPELTDEEIEKILEFIALLAKQTVSNYKRSMELLKKDEVK
jgi:hypothetical protein